MLREAAAQRSAEAYHQLYEHHRSWDRGDLDKVPLVTRAEAGQALRKAAELGHPFSTQMLIRQLEDGRHHQAQPRRRAILGRTCRRGEQKTRAKEAC